MSGYAPGQFSMPPGEPEVPAPPPGPGVMPPFAMPPADRNRRGLWIGLGAGALVLVLCCMGGIFGFGLLAVSTSRQVETNAVNTVDEYLGALQDSDYTRAYSLLCRSLTRRETLSEFAARERARPIRDFHVGAAEVGNDVVVPADLVYASGDRVTRRYLLNQELGSQNMRICGVR